MTLQQCVIVIVDAFGPFTLNEREMHEVSFGTPIARQQPTKEGLRNEREDEVSFLRECAVIIEVSWPYTPDELRHAYRDAAMRHHPDRGGDPERMIAISIAKDRLDRELVRSEATA